MVLAANTGSNKKRRSKALLALSQMTKYQLETLRDIYVAYKSNDIEKANKVAEEATSDTTEFLINFFSYKDRPIDYSSGEVGKMLDINFMIKLKELGYSTTVSQIIPFVVLDNYNVILDKMATKQKKSYTKPNIVILGEVIDPENMPRLYNWAENNPETLEKQLDSIAKAWHEGNIRSAMLALESDLQHG